MTLKSAPLLHNNVKIPWILHTALKKIGMLRQGDILFFVSLDCTKMHFEDISSTKTLLSLQINLKTWYEKLRPEKLKFIEEISFCQFSISYYMFKIGMKQYTLCGLYIFHCGL